MEALSALTWHVLSSLAFSFGGRLIPDKLQKESREIVNREFPESLLEEALNAYIDIAYKSCDLASIAELARSFYPGSGGKSTARSLYIPGDSELSFRERIESEGRLVIIGEPGTGKTSLIKWLAGAYLLRLKNNPELSSYPGIDTLPDRDLVPIVARCRDIDRHNYDEWYRNILVSLNDRFNFTGEMIVALTVALKRKIENGSAILLVDGIDEASIDNIHSHQALTISSLAENFRRLPIVVTSTEALSQSWRSMAGFFEQHTLSPFTSDQKNEFARRWCSVAWPEKRRNDKSTALIEAIHSSPEIEKLTDLPMHLSMLAQVMDRGATVPENLAQLYNLAVRALIDSPNEDSGVIDRRDAMPQLEYIAGEMWRKDLTRAPESAILKWLDSFHEKHPELKPVRDHTSDEFLRLVKRRTKILVESSDFRHENPDDRDYEFRHIIYRNFLASKAEEAGYI